ncbi:cytochrome P450 [Mycena galericulata]|nr:cytochrome P450 [Mycena galericulata]
MMYTTAAAALFVVLALYFLSRVNRGIQTVVGPPSPSWVFGHMLQLLLAPQWGDYEFKWLKQFGAVYAPQYILKSAHFDYGPVLKNVINILYGKTSVVAPEGVMRRRVRTALNVGFTASAVRNYQPLFEKAAQKVTEQLENASTSPVDICPLLSNATLGAVSEAVLGYSTKELGDDFLENNCQIVVAGSQSPNQILYLLLEAAFYLPTATLKAKLDAAGKGLEINDDVYSLLLNPQQSDKTSRALSGEEVVNQTAIILIAGQDTTMSEWQEGPIHANTLAFSLLELAKNLDLQHRLRAEIYSMIGAGGRIVAYDNMLLLNAFVKEAFRLYPAEAITDRIAREDMVLPLSKSIVISDGEHISQIPIRKGQVVTVAIASKDWTRGGALTPTNSNPHAGSKELLTRGKSLVHMRTCTLTFLSGAHTCLG